MPAGSRDLQARVEDPTGRARGTQNGRVWWRAEVALDQYDAHGIVSASRDADLAASVADDDEAEALVR
ncbi:MAG: hypothetical protein ACR2MB_00660 [Acidimicrobiales bacterium]